MAKKDKFRTNIGGQALIEGIMMRGPDKVAIVVRRPDKTLAIKEEPYIPLKQRNKLLGLPLVRGACSLVISLISGMNALMWAAEQALDEDDKPKVTKKLEETIEKLNEAEGAEKQETSESSDTAMGKMGVSKKEEKGIFVMAIILGLAIAVGLFIVLPNFLGGLLFNRFGEDVDRVYRVLFETSVRVALLVLYMLAVSRMKDIQRTFSYHGAEHKAIACYEAGEPLTVENVTRHTRFHPRCGTSFLLMVMLVSFGAFLLIEIPIRNYVDTGNLLIRSGIKLAILPLVVGVTYEINRYIGAHDNWFTRFLRAPGIWLQRITTNEPDESMIEIGIEALTCVLPSQQADAEWGKE